MKKYYIISLLFVLFFISQLSSLQSIEDVSKTAQYYVHAIEKPTSIEELRNIVIHARTPISIAGGRFSQGGHIAAERGTVIDMSGLSYVTHLDLAKKQITVQAGMIWRDLQKFIDTHNLSIEVMQSYNDFSIGGSLAVNAHGREVAHGQIIQTVKSVRLMLTDGSIVRASRTEHEDLFAAVIGGYGRLGILVDVTLQLTDNIKIERAVQMINPYEYTAWLKHIVLTNPNVVFHNAQLYPNDFNKMVTITWSKTDKPLTCHKRLRRTKKFFPVHMLAEQLLRRIAPLKKYRLDYDMNQLRDPAVVWRNYEMSYTARSLEPLTRSITTSILQEYFIPIDRVNEFIDVLRLVVNKYEINVLNCSLRWVPGNMQSVLTYAPTDSVAFVLYINKLNTAKGRDYQRTWAQKLIDAAHALGGTFYLPYELMATRDQMHAVYPNIQKYESLQKKYDPAGIFSNRFWQAYA